MQLTLVLTIQIISALAVAGFILWLYFDPGLEPLFASLVSLLALTGTTLRDHLRHQEAIRTDIQHQIDALIQLKQVVGNIPPNLNRYELQYELQTDEDFRNGLIHHLIRLFGLRNELIPFIDPRLTDLIDKQFQPLFEIQTGTYILKPYEIHNLVAFTEQIRSLLATIESDLTERYTKTLK